MHFRVRAGARNGHLTAIVPLLLQTAHVSVGLSPQIVFSDDSSWRSDLFYGAILPNGYLSGGCGCQSGSTFGLDGTEMWNRA